MNGLIIRPCRPADAIGLAILFHRAVHEGTGAQYDAAQRAAWSPAPPTDALWRARIEEATTIVAERDGVPLGFMTLDLGCGFLDFAYVAPEAIGRGVGATLYAVIEGRARVAGHRRLETEASLVAEPFFRRRGWQVVRRQQVERLGVALPNAAMAKELLPIARAAA